MRSFLLLVILALIISFVKLLPDIQRPRQEASNQRPTIVPQESQAYNNQGTVRTAGSESGTAENYHHKGVKYAAEGKFDQARDEFVRALQADPLYRHAKGSLKTIQDVTDQRIKRETAIHLFKATNYGIKGMFDESIAEFDKAIETNPGYALAYNDRGFTYLNRNQYDRAISDFSKALERDARFPEPYVNRGIVYFKKGQYDQAVSDFDKALAIDPRLPEPYINRGVIYHTKGLYEQAIGEYNKALEIKPSFAELYFNKALACEKAGRKKEAVDAYKGFIQYAPSEPQNVQYIEQARRRIRELGGS